MEARLGKRLLQNVQILVQGRVQPLVHETLKWLQIVRERAALQSVEIGLAIFRAHGNWRIAFAYQQKVH